MSNEIEDVVSEFVFGPIVDSRREKKGTIHGRCLLKGENECLNINEQCNVC